jgi:hypothetical protein
MLGIVGRFSGSESSSYRPGEGPVQLVIPGSQYVNVAVSESACKEMEEAFADAAKSYDEERLIGLLLNGLMFPADNHSEVVVLERRAGRARVRIVSGNQTGEYGWVPVGWLSR